MSREAFGSGADMGAPLECAEIYVAQRRKHAIPTGAG
jgi:hypothetical protein